LDRCIGRVSGIEELEEFDELAAAVTVFDEGMDLASEQINPGQQAERAVALVFMIARECRDVTRAPPSPQRAPARHHFRIKVLNVRFCPDSEHRADVARGPKGANN